MDAIIWIVVGVIVVAGLTLLVVLRERRNRGLSSAAHGEFTGDRAHTDAVANVTAGALARRGGGAI